MEMVLTMHQWFDLIVLQNFNPVYFYYLWAKISYISVYLAR